jgi:hypothetical protein
MKPKATQTTYEHRQMTAVQRQMKPPSATEVEANGINLGNMSTVLLKKIEELTLYIIQLQNQSKPPANYIFPC